MAETLLQGIHTAIRARLREAEPTVHEYARLEAALAALDGVVLHVLEERPRVSVAELTAASGVQRTVLYTLLKTLEQRGEIAKEQLPGGSTGYRPSPASTEPPAAQEPPAGDSV